MTHRLALATIAAVALASPLWPCPRAAAQTAPRAAEPAIAFDQIGRLLLHGATPPPLGSFADDAARIASLPPLDANVQKLQDAQKRALSTASATPLIGMLVGLIPFVGGLIGAGAAHAANAAAQANLQHQIDEERAASERAVNAGSLSRFAFYHGWSRSERAGRDVTIVDPDRNTTTVLDLRRKTARIYDARATSDEVVATTSEALPPRLDGVATTARLPDGTFDGMQARGYRTTGTLDLASVLGWCASGPHAVAETEYVVDLPDPEGAPDRTPAPLADACAPHSTASYDEPGRLVVYRATSVDLGTPVAVTLFLERGNIRVLDRPDPSLFSIPPDYTQEHD